MATKWITSLVLLALFDSARATTLGQPIKLAQVSNEVHLCLERPNPRRLLPDYLQMTVSPHQGSQEFYLVRLKRKGAACYRLEPEELLRGNLSAVLSMGGGAGTGKIFLRLAIRCNPKMDACLMFKAEKSFSTQSQEDFEELLQLQRRGH